MPKFKVCLQQYVERVATVEVDAADGQQAIAIAKTDASKATWKDGDDAYSVECYAVKNADDELVWERS